METIVTSGARFPKVSVTLGPKIKVSIKNLRIKVQILACTLVHFVLLTDIFNMLSANCPNLDLQSKHQQLSGPVNYWDFRERGPRAETVATHGNLTMECHLYIN